MSSSVSKLNLKKYQKSNLVFQKIEINIFSLILNYVFKRKYEYTREKLVEFKKKLEAKTNTQKSGGDEDAGGLGGGFGGGASSSKANSAKKHSDQQKSLEQANQLTLMDGLKPLWQNKDGMSRLMRQTVQAQEIKLKFEHKQLLLSIEEKIKIFDAELKVLRHEKARIAVLMKNADLRHVTIFEEFLLLRDFEKTENDLEQKQIKRKEDHTDVQTQLKELLRKIDAKRKDIEQLDSKQKQLVENYNHLTHDEMKFSDFLYKVFKRKIKRKKKAEGEEEEG